MKHFLRLHTLAPPGAQKKKKLHVHRFFFLNMHTHQPSVARAPLGASDRWLFVLPVGMSAPKKKARIVFDVGDEAAGSSNSAAALAASAGAPAAALAAGAKKGVAFSDAPAPAASASASAPAPAPAPDAGLAVQDLATLDVSTLNPLTPAILSRQVCAARSRDGEPSCSLAGTLLTACE